jgi:hypothetical protein
MLTPDDIRTRLRSGTLIVVSCMKATALLRLGYRRGFHCAQCGVEVQMSERAQDQVKAGALVMCNPCGIGLAEWARDDGRSSEVFLSPEAQAAISRGHTEIDPARFDALVKKP